MPNRLFQSIITHLKDDIDRVVGVVDKKGLIVACSSLSQIGSYITGEESDNIFSDKVVTFLGYTIKPMGVQARLGFAVFVEGEDDIAKKYSAVISASIEAAKVYYDDKFDRTSFVKNIIFDNILPSETYQRAKSLRFQGKVNRVCFYIVPFGNIDTDPFDILQNLFPDKWVDFIIGLDQNKVVLVKELPNNYTKEMIEDVAKSIIDTLMSEYYVKCLIGIGTVASDITELAKSFKEAQMAIEVGNVFDMEKNIVSYDNLGIARLIYKLPTVLCQAFLNEVFKNDSVSLLDNETLFTIQKFFENNLNISETSRKLFVHRNTLVYRLDKIKKVTGLDLREFDNAIIFKVALMVKKYLESNPSNR